MVWSGEIQVMQPDRWKEGSAEKTSGAEEDVDDVPLGRAREG